MSETRDHVSIHIDNILLGLPSSPCKATIFRVDGDQRSTNEKLYDPKILSAGPFHHSKDYLQKMEEHKFRYLKLLLKRRKESTVDKYVMAIRSLEERARRCYAEPVELGPDEFVQMLLLDGFFIIELIRKYEFKELRESKDTIFQYEQVLRQLSHDLVLVENQVPFFVLDQLFTMTRSGNPDDNLIYLTELFILDISPWPNASNLTEQVRIKDVDHLLGLAYKIWFSPVKNFTEEEKMVVVNSSTEMVAINSSTELQEAGIKFEKDTESNCLDIKFIKGVIKIPDFGVSDETESILRNVIAYEHFFNKHPKRVTDYAFFLHCLINSSKDVEILRRHGIVTNLLGDDEMIYQMFNRLGKNILISSEFCYADVYDKVNGHCGHRRNRWMAILRHDYFNSPWSFISFFAALMLLLFTLTQTLFSVLSYTKSK